MTISDFITKAIEGGWNSGVQQRIKDGAIVNETVDDGSDIVRVIFWYKDGHELIRLNEFNQETLYVTKQKILLDHLAWQAVGKTEGWNSARSAGETFDQKQYHVTFDMHSWEFQWFCLIDALAEGKTIEEFLSTL